jgi:hypothetical protein
MSLDQRRADAAGQELEPVPAPASTTAVGLAKRFTDEAFTGIETAIAAINARAPALLGQVRHTALARQVTLDIDATDIEVYGRAKTGSAHNYQGQRPSPDLGPLTLVQADLLAGIRPAPVGVRVRTRVRPDESGGLFPGGGPPQPGRPDCPVIFGLWQGLVVAATQARQPPDHGCDPGYPSGDREHRRASFGEMVLRLKGDARLAREPGPGC